MVIEFYFKNASLDGQVHFLKNKDTFIERVLCYPRNTCIELKERLEILIQDGFIYLLEAGREILGLRIIGKGYSSVVTIAYHGKHGLGSLKILRIDSRRSSLVHEAQMMIKAEPSRLPPKLYLYRDLYVFYEHLPLHTCSNYTDILIDLVLKKDIKTLTSLLERTLESLYVLDTLRVDHTEINRPSGHILYCNNEVKILDWESARLVEKPTNITSFISFLLYRFKYRDKLREILKYNSAGIMKLLSEYKSNYSREVFNELLISLLYPG